MCQKQTLWIPSSEEKETFVTHIARKLQEGGILLTIYRNFEQLYGAVEKLIGSEKGIGDLMLYDIARMIGYSMQPTVLPVKPCVFTEWC